MTTKQYELTEAEWDIIQVVWEREPCAAPEVQEELVARKKWTYSTVKTLMDRMVAKGLLTTELMRTVKRAFGGAFTPMMQFMLESDALSQKELQELQGMIQKKRRQNKAHAQE
jgi:BlaI family penicillinase repressor